jgi:hypothetical protein
MRKEKGKRGRGEKIATRRKEITLRSKYVRTTAATNAS